MAEQLYSITRPLKKVSVTTTAPAPTADTPDPTDTGVLAVTDAIDVDLSSQQGGPPKVRFLIGRTSSATYTLLVYGMLKVSNSGGWVPILLYKASVAATATPGGTANAAAFDTNDKAAGAITVDAAVASGIHQTMSAGSDGLSHVLLDTRGCSHLVFYSTDSAGFVLVGPAS